MPDFIPRPAQAHILKYDHGKMGIAAVPGSGKTHTLSYLAATLIASDKVRDGQEVLIVTLVNSAVQNFSKRVGGFVHELGLIENIGYRVRTLHGLAHDIVRERPDLAGLENNFQILDERASSDILDQIVSTWMRNHQDFLVTYTHPESQEAMQYLSSKWKMTLLSMAASFIHQAKDMELTPEMVNTSMANNHSEHELLRFGTEIYRDYQNALRYQAAIDFEDLIRLAYKTLQMDADYLQRLQERWSFILEDEAQDSSALQEKILGLLCGEHGNWVRVGDPNQAIYETFTTADPKYLLQFLQRKDVQAFDLPNSGRSTHSIMALANHLIKWNGTQPSPALTYSLVPPLIEPTPADDPQPNPPDAPEKIFLFTEKLSAEKEEDMVVQSVTRWIRENPQQTVAILVTRNDKGASLVQKLKNKKVPTVELLQTSFSTRTTAKKLADLLDYFADPTSSKKLSAAFESLYKDTFEEPEQKKTMHTFCDDLKKQSLLEEFLFPSNGNLINQTELNSEDELMAEVFRKFTEFLSVNQRAALLPIQQLILTLSSQLFTDAHELALAYKLAEVLEREAKANPTSGLKDFAAELDKVYHNRLRITGFSEEELEFDPDQHKGEVVVATIHKAKGLEWDRVYIVSANNYDFPCNQPYDQYISEKYFIRDHLNLEAEMLAHLKALNQYQRVEEGEATLQARKAYSAERIRLFYVGITRARKELVITWNEGKFNNCVMAIPFVELTTFWEDEHASHA
ncbi:MAG TPA: ATP-dependent helicase [Anaerolineaceae bacterium]|uniref:DNA 3'-5' helicase n=1 Tax=Anaerolinea thermophila TaxID=167964 RepID=A0A101FZ19_9CHLR|nr:MAG: Putative ATP-dependent DNA helicase [Anaerolinea thermophila]HAF61094.1 ATP-dependent helicase [Anaerolineaceae bacterium]